MLDLIDKADLFDDKYESIQVRKNALVCTSRKTSLDYLENRK